MTERLFHPDDESCLMLACKYPRNRPVQKQDDVDRLLYNLAVGTGRRYVDWQRTIIAAGTCMLCGGDPWSFLVKLVDMRVQMYRMTYRDVNSRSGTLLTPVPADFYKPSFSTTAASAILHERQRCSRTACERLSRAFRCLLAERPSEAVAEDGDTLWYLAAVLTSLNEATMLRTALTVVINFLREQECRNPTTPRSSQPMCAWFARLISVAMVHASPGALAVAIEIARDNGQLSLALDVLDLQEAAVRDGPPEGGLPEDELPDTEFPDEFPSLPFRFVFPMLAPNCRRDVLHRLLTCFADVLEKNAKTMTATAAQRLLPWTVVMSSYAKAWRPLRMSMRVAAFIEQRRHYPYSTVGPVIPPHAASTALSLLMKGFRRICVENRFRRALPGAFTNDYIALSPSRTAFAYGKAIDALRGAGAVWDDATQMQFATHFAADPDVGLGAYLVRNATCDAARRVLVDSIVTTDHPFRKPRVNRVALTTVFDGLCSAEKEEVTRGGDALQSANTIAAWRDIRQRIEAQQAEGYRPPSNAMTDNDAQAERDSGGIGFRRSYARFAQESETMRR